MVALFPLFGMLQFGLRKGLEYAADVGKAIGWMMLIAGILFLLVWAVMP